MKTVCVSVIVALVSVGPVSAAVLFDGSASPVAQGWTRLATDGLDEGTSDGSVFTINTVGTSAAGARTSAFDRYTRFTSEIGTAGYDVVTRLRVPTAAFNSLDGAAVLMVGGNAATLAGDTAARSSMVIFSPTAVQWGDLTQSSAVDATQFHVYRLSVTSAGNATLFIDGASALTRANYTSSGTVSFGDQTNDPNVDGRMDVDYLSVTAVPEPTTLAMAGVAAAGLLRRRRR